MIFNKGMYDKEFKFTDDSGKEQSIIIKPLPTKYTKTLYKIGNAFNTTELKQYEIKDEDSEELKTEKSFKANEIILSKLTEGELLDSIIELVTITVNKGYPDIDKELVDEFVGRNWMTLLPFIIKVNLNLKSKNE